MPANSAPEPPVFTLRLPPRIDGREPGTQQLKAGASAVFLGANGAGKTRLAGWFDKALGNIGTFIHARRSIEMPRTYSIAGENEQLAAIYAGTLAPHWGDIAAMKNWRYLNNQNPYSSSDFANVLNIIGAKDAAASRKFRVDSRSSSAPVQTVRTELDAALEIWSNCLPHLVIDADKTPELFVKRIDDPSHPYEPGNMSDGERAIFY